MSVDEKKSLRGPSPIVVLYRDGASDDCSTLTHLTQDFSIIGHGEGKAVVCLEKVNLTIEADMTTAPSDGDMSLVEKLTLRFEKAFAEAQRGETGVRVDLRFCSGNADTRRPEQDNLRPDYAGGWKP